MARPHSTRWLYRARPFEIWGKRCPCECSFSELDVEEGPVEQGLHLEMLKHVTRNELGDVRRLTRLLSESALLHLHRAKGTGGILCSNPSKHGTT
jgi:hypothetical protein